LLANRGDLRRAQPYFRALRSAIRTHLQTHKAIEKLRPGEQNEGGDGVTVAFLRG
jgi:hypothetical protein